MISTSKEELILDIVFYPSLQIAHHNNFEFMVQSLNMPSKLNGRNCTPASIPGTLSFVNPGNEELTRNQSFI